MNKVYFGTREKMKWVKAPAVNTSLSSAGWSNVGTGLNGGGYAYMSPTNHREYQFTWGASPADDIYDIVDYRTGIYGRGLLYYVDPFAMKSNILPPEFSTPWRLAEIGITDAFHTVPGLTGGSTTLEQPLSTRTLRSTSSPIGTTRATVPPGYKLWVAYVATSNILATYSGTRLTNTLPGASTYTWNEISATTELAWMPSAVGQHIWGAVGVLLPIGETPHPTHKWVEGKGNWGLRFASEPQITGISAKIGGARGLLNASVTLKETGLWESNSL